MCFDSFEDLDGAELPSEPPTSQVSALPLWADPCIWSARQRLVALLLLILAAGHYWVLLPSAFNKYYVISASSMVRQRETREAAAED